MSSQPYSENDSSKRPPAASSRLRRTLTLDVQNQLAL